MFISEMVEVLGSMEEPPHGTLVHALKLQPLSFAPHSNICRFSFDAPVFVQSIDFISLLRFESFK